MAMLRGARPRIAAVVAALISAIFTGLIISGSPAFADGKEPPMSAEEVQKAKGVTQVIPLGTGTVNLELRKGYAFVTANDVPPILEKLGVAAPSGTILGAVTADGAQVGAKGYWISVVTEDQIGHVPETGADQISSVTFLDSVKAARPPEPKLASFAITPAYAQGSKTLTWAEKYDVKTAANLKHEARILGRDSVIGVTTFGPSSALKKISRSGDAVASMVTFAPGHLYADFVPATDRASEYDLPGLITGKRKAGPLVETADAGAAPANATSMQFAAADFMPGGKYQLATYGLGGLLGLGVLYLIFSAVRGRSGGSHDDETPSDNNPNAV